MYYVISKWAIVVKTGILLLFYKSQIMKEQEVKTLVSRGMAID